MTYIGIIIAISLMPATMVLSLYFVGQWIANRELSKASKMVCDSMVNEVIN